MTQDELDLMKERDGCYILGHHSRPFVTHLVGVLAGHLFNVSPSNQLSERAGDWGDGAYLVAGPLTVQRMREMNERAQQIEEQITTLTHDLEVWHERALAAEAKLALLTQ